MAVRILLLVLALAWTPYGIYCLVDPGFLGEFAGINTSTPWAVTELRAMYGGVQVALGLSALLGFMRVVSVDKALFTQLVAAMGLGLTRLCFALIGGDWSQYTVTALVFELTMIVLCVLAVRSQSKSASA